jgi:hypothetical protein
VYAVPVEAGLRLKKASAHPESFGRLGGGCDGW